MCEQNPAGVHKHHDLFRVQECCTEDGTPSLNNADVTTSRARKQRRGAPDPCPGWARGAKH
eukprot:2152691-Lingulodinium_polyedra.AAC.1